MKGLSADFKTILGFGTPFAITVFLFAIILKFGFAKISEVRLKVNEARRDEAILTQKLNSLTQVTDSVISSSTSAIAALPESNPALIVISQIKNLAAEKGVLLTNLKTGSEAVENSSIKRIDISFDIESRRDLVMSFLTDIKTLAPISLIDKVKINESAGISRGSITIKSFWSELPQKLPPLNESLKDLTNEEIVTLTTISTLVQPIFLDIQATEPTAREDPFNQ